jgi:tripartite-type tricarboxylate transporter receptor subunit TctC
MRLTLALLFALISALPTHAQDWPSKPIRIVVPFAPGGAADVWARVIAEPLSAALKQPVVIENRGGSGGMLAAQQVARGEPDGYTILVGGLAPQIISPSLAANPGFDTMKDFVHIAYIGGPPMVWVADPKNDLRSVKDVIAAAKADKLSAYATSGVGTLGHLVVEFVAEREGLKLNHVPYNTAAFADIIAGRIPIGSFTWGAALGQIQGGTLRGLAVTTETRRPEAPDVPTFKELGYDLVASTWFSFAAPKGTPDAVVRRLNAETVRIMKLPDIQKRRDQDAFDPREFTPEQLTAYFEAEMKRWGPVAQEAGMKK